MDVNGPLSAREAQKLAKEIVDSPDGYVRFGGHALQRMKERKVSEGDVRNTLRFGRCFEDGCENGTWRYRPETNKFRVVIAFRSEKTVVVVTVLRFDRN